MWFVCRRTARAVCTMAPTGKDFLSVSDLKKKKNYDFMDILNDEQNDNDFIYGYNSDVNESPYNNVNFNCDYYDENEIISKFANNRGDLLCFSLNIQSLPSKFIEFTDLLNYFSSKKVYFDVICLQELWTLHDPTMFNIEGYHFIFKGRKSGVQGGGVGLYIRSDLKFKLIPEYSIFIDKVIETIFVEIEVNEKKKIIVSSVYRPNGPHPNLTQSQQLDQFYEMFSNIIE